MISILNNLVISVYPFYFFYLWRVNIFILNIFKSNFSVINTKLGIKNEELMNIIDNKQNISVH